MIINNYIPAYLNQTLTDGSRSILAVPGSFSLRPSPLTVPGLCDDVVDAYCEWYCSKVRCQDQKEQYKLARDLMLERGLDLELVHEDNDVQFYIERGVLEGVV